MGKKVSADELDEGLVKTQEATKLSVCTTEPNSYAEATTLEPGGRALAIIDMTSGDLILAAGDTPNGRKLRIIAPSALTIGASGTAQHVALAKDVGSELLAVTTCNPLALDVGGGANTVTVPEYKREIPQPS